MVKTHWSHLEGRNIPQSELSSCKHHPNLFYIKRPQKPVYYRYNQKGAFESERIILLFTISKCRFRELVIWGGELLSLHRGFWKWVFDLMLWFWGKGGVRGGWWRGLEKVAEEELDSTSNTFLVVAEPTTASLPQHHAFSPNKQKNTIVTKIKKIICNKGNTAKWTSVY